MDVAAQDFWLCTANVSISSMIEPVYGLVTVPCIHLANASAAYQRSSIEGGLYTRACSSIGLLQARRNVRASKGLLIAFGSVGITIVLLESISAWRKSHIVASPEIAVTPTNFTVIRLSDHRKLVL